MTETDSPQSEPIKPLPSPQDFFLKIALYEYFYVFPKDKETLFNIIFYQGVLDCFCLECGKNSVFKSIENRPSANPPIYDYVPIKASGEWKINVHKDDLLVIKQFNCVRNNKHFLAFNFLLSDQIFQKIGQYPSIADLSAHNIKKFRKTLGVINYVEFNKAIGLFSHGIGVGSFVYLRRILENFIIKPAHEKAKQSDRWDEEEYQKLRVTERIKRLKDFLPYFLSSNSVLYSIISKGIHELTEEECKEYFPILRESIEYVLAEIQNQKEKEQREKHLTEQINRISKEIK